MEFHHIVAHDIEVDGEVEGNEESIASPDPSIWSEVMRFFANPRKPMILALSRPDPKKNITTLVKAFGECRPLRELANLTLILGNREGIDEMSNTSSSVLLSILKLIDKYDLYGQVAYPKHHKQYEVPEIYRLAAKTKGVFINPAFIEPFGLTLIEATAHGLPIVATKNGGPVDIHRVLENGLLVDPHDEKAIADALLNLVADKQLWMRCRHNGLKNIHLFSWPEHCKTYLSRISTFKPRHPQWQGPEEWGGPQPHSPGDSLRDIQDISLNLKFSLDLEKKDEEGTPDPATTTTTAAPEVEKAVLRWSKGVSLDSKKGDSNNNNNNNSTGGRLKRRRKVFVIAMDGGGCRVGDGIKAVREAVEGKEGVGFVVSTCMGIWEVHQVLVSAGISHMDFDAFICNSGGDLYYPTATCEEEREGVGLPYVGDTDYESHIEYRWAGEEVRKTLVRWAAAGGGGGGAREDKVNSSRRCYTFRMEDDEEEGWNMRRRGEEVRKEMRIQALRCNVVCCEKGRRMNVVPVLASRAQAMRYLYVRWGMELGKSVVFVGGEGDSDYQGLLRGAHKTIVLLLQHSHSREGEEKEEEGNVFFTCDAASAPTSSHASLLLRNSLLKLGILNNPS